MHEDVKLDEAARFLGSMQNAQDRHDATAFTDALSAFTTAGRSVLQYAFKEAKANGRLDWYDKAVAVRPRIGFFRDLRDANVHERPVDPARATSVNILAPVALADAAFTAPRVSSGDTTVEPERAAPSAAPVPPEGRAEITTTFFLIEWKAGPEDALTLAELYLADVRAVVADGRAKGILTA
jgi:hypothetical protein